MTHSERIKRLKLAIKIVSKEVEQRDLYGGWCMEPELDNREKMECLIKTKPFDFFEAGRQLELVVRHYGNKRALLAE